MRRLGSLGRSDAGCWPRQRLGYGRYAIRAWQDIIISLAVFRYCGLNCCISADPDPGTVIQADDINTVLCRFVRLLHTYRMFIT